MKSLGRIRPRVYTPLLLALVVTVVIAWWGPLRAARGQVDVSVESAMTKGAPGARVTIFEFSDYE